MTAWDSPNHPIIDCPSSYRIVRLDFHIEPDDYRKSFIDLTLERGGEVRHLRFVGPQSLVIEEGFPMWTGGMVIRDIRERQWDDLKVQVDDFEASGGNLKFYAADVIDLDASPEQCRTISD